MDITNAVMLYTLLKGYRGSVSLENLMFFRLPQLFFCFPGFHQFSFSKNCKLEKVDFKAVSWIQTPYNCPSNVGERFTNFSY